MSYCTVTQEVSSGPWHIATKVLGSCRTRESKIIYEIDLICFARCSTWRIRCLQCLNAEDPFWYISGTTQCTWELHGLLLFQPLSQDIFDKCTDFYYFSTGNLHFVAWPRWTPDYMFCSFPFLMSLITENVYTKKGNHFSDQLPVTSQVFQLFLAE